MSSIKVIGGEQLKGELKIQGSKNAALPVIAATILNKGISILKNCPRILDVFHMIKILEELGCKTSWEENTLIVDSTDADNTHVSEESVSKMRSSILYLGALLGRFHEATIAYPGGCSIGKRPINFHLTAIGKMNVSQEFLGEEENIIHCFTDKIIGNDIFFQSPSVGATQNVILTAVLSEGITRIYNAAREPEVVELCNYLLEAGAHIYGEGTSYIIVEGVSRLYDVEFLLSPDRIVAGTYMAAVAATKGDIILLNAPGMQLTSPILALTKIGCQIEVKENSVRVSCNNRPKPIDVLRTQPYPGFPTDMQSQLMSILCMAEGRSIIQESIFESRFQNVDELIKMGADISLEKENNKAIICGVNQLHGAVINAHDLRGTAALIIAGLAAQEITTVCNADYIDRGYEDICRDLTVLGAKIYKISD